MHSTRPDPYILPCCSITPTIGVDPNCLKTCLFCPNHTPHLTDSYLTHNTISLSKIRSKISENKLIMHNKTAQLIKKFTQIMNKLIKSIQDMKIRKSAQLSMLWLRDMASSQYEYQLLVKVYGMNFLEISCQDIHKIYHKIVKNNKLFNESLEDIPCYKHISHALNQLSNTNCLQLISNKLLHLEGILKNGEILKKVLTDQSVSNLKTKQILLESSCQDFAVQYNKAYVLKNCHGYLSGFSKYVLTEYMDYYVGINTRYGNLMMGICSQNVKNSNQTEGIHYNPQSIVYNISNGNIYQDGMFTGSFPAFKDLKEIHIKLRITQNQVLLFTNKQVLMRCNREKLGVDVYLVLFGRTHGDSFEVRVGNSEGQFPNGKSWDSLVKKEQIKQFIKQKQKVDKLINYVNEQPLHQSFQPISNNLLQFETKNPETSKINQQIARIKAQIDLLGSKSHKIHQFSTTRQKITQIKIQKIQNPTFLEQEKNQQQKSSTNLNLQKYAPRKMSDQSSVFEKVYTNSQFQNSKIKINISDQASQMKSLAKVSVMSVLRKGSDLFKKTNIKLPQGGQMAQSMTTVNFSKNQNANEKIKIKTPPKIVAFNQRFEINDSFEF